MAIVAPRFRGVDEERCLPAEPISNFVGQTDSDLLEECRAGCVAAFERLYQIHGARMKSIALNVLGNPSDAEDSVQETFLKISRHMGDFRGKSTLSTWIYRILFNTCHDLVRKRRRRKEVSDFDHLSGGYCSAAPSDHPLRITLERSLNRLKPRYRNVFLLYEVEGFKHREIAEILNMSEGASKNALFEAKRKLQKMVLSSRSGKGG